MATQSAEPTVFLWQGRDKRGVKVKGQQIAASPNLVRAELRRQGINDLGQAQEQAPARRRWQPHIGQGHRRVQVPAGVTSFTVSVPTTSDTIDEADETYTLTVGGVSAPAPSPTTIRRRPLRV